MSWNEPPDITARPLPDKPQSLSWQTLFLRILGGYVIYGLAHYYVDPSGMMMVHGSVVKTVVGNAFLIFLLFSAFLVPTSLIALVLARVTPKNRKKPLTIFLNRALVAALLISAVGLYFGSVATKLLVRQEKVASSATTRGPDPVVAAITIQAANGLTVQNFDQAWLKHAESWVVEMVTTKVRNAASEHRKGTSIDPKVEAESMYIVIQGKKLAVNKTRSSIKSETSRLVAIWGLEGENLIHVTCYRLSDDEIPILSGECGNKIKEAYGVATRP